MGNQKLDRVFDRVKLSREREEAMLADLLMEEKEGSGMKQTNRRRLPAAVLAAAMLAAVLAGTALAVEYFGKVRIEHIDGFVGHKEGYFAYGPSGSGIIPADSFSEDVLALCADMEWNENAKLPFRSWSEAEEYLGIELADNPVLEQFTKYNGIHYEGTAPTGHPEKRGTHCLLTISADETQHLPCRIELDTCASKGNCTVNQWVQLLTDAAGEEDKTGAGAALRGETAFQEYVTPSGLEVMIYSEVVPERGYDRTIYMAHFVKNGAFFTVQLISRSSPQSGQGGEAFYDPWDTLIEVLDAYE